MEFQHDPAEIYNATGSAQEDRGNMPEALKNYCKAIPMYDELLARNPQDRAIRRSLSVTFENIGRALFLSNEAAGALENNRKALALREALLSEDPTNADYRRICRNQLSKQR